MMSLIKFPPRYLIGIQPPVGGSFFCATLAIAFFHVCLDRRKSVKFRQLVYAQITPCSCVFPNGSSVAQT